MFFESIVKKGKKWTKVEIFTSQPAIRKSANRTVTSILKLNPLLSQFGFNVFSNGHNCYEHDPMLGTTK